MAIVNIDPHAGFCPGVTKTISTAIDLLNDDTPVYSLGELVHCPEELNRLENDGLKVIAPEDVPSVHHSRILIRAHGVTPQVQFKLAISDNDVVDATCSIVRRLQQKIKTVSHRMNELDGQIVIFGKKKHPEVEGLIGYCNSKVIITEDPSDLSDIDLRKPVSVFAQTTTNVEDYEHFIHNLVDASKKSGYNQENIQVYNTICGSIKTRVPNLKVFAAEHDVVIFVSGENSSNGAYLSSICRRENSRTYKISAETQLDPQWLTNAEKIGITGAASTPVWLLEKVASVVQSLVN